MNFRADIYTGERKVLVRYFEADTSDEAVETARQEVVATGNDHADVWEGDDLNRAAYVDTVGVER